MSTQPQTNTINIIEINVNSLIAKDRRQNLKVFLNMHKPHVVLLAETNLSITHRLNFTGYTFVRTDKTLQTGSRGTGILVKSSVKFHTINTTAWNLKSLQTTAVLIEAENRLKYLIVAAYRNPSGDLLDVNDLDTIIQNQCNLVLGGDLNAKHVNWRNTSTCRNGSLLADWIFRNSITQRVTLIHTAEPTYYRSRYSSYLDVFITSDNLDVVFPTHTPGLLAIRDYPSDHRAVEIVLNVGSSLIKSDPILVPNYLRTDWRAFNDHIDSRISDDIVKNNINMTPQQIDIAVHNVTILVNSAVDNIIPKIRIHGRDDIPIPDSLKHIIDEKNRLRRRWQRKRYEHNEYQLKSEIKCLEKIIRDQLRIVHTEHWQKTLSDIKLDNHTFANIKKFTKSSNINSVYALKKDNSQIVTTDTAEKAEIFSNFLKVFMHKINNLEVRY